MKMKNVLAKIFAVCGAAITCGAVLFVLLTAAVGTFMAKHLLLDYLMLAEIFPIVVLGILLLFVASLLTKRLVRPFAYLSAAAVITLAGALLIASQTGLSSGAIPAPGWQFALVVGLISLYDLLVVAIGVVGIVFAARLFHKPAVDESLTAIEALEDSGSGGEPQSK